MDKAKISERLNSITELLKEKQEKINLIENQQRVINETQARLNIEKLQLTDSFQKLLGELKEIEQEMQILKQKTLEVIS